MIPGTYNLTIKQGDTLPPIPITLPSFVDFGGPADLTGCEVTAELHFEGRRHPMQVNVIDAVLREIDLTMTADATASLQATTARRKAHWELQVKHTTSGWVGTPLEGDAVVRKERVR